MTQLTLQVEPCPKKLLYFEIKCLPTGDLVH